LRETFGAIIGLSWVGDSAAKLVTRDEARRLAMNIDKLPEPLKGPITR
jgi:hypothetical protein